MLRRLGVGDLAFQAYRLEPEHGRYQGCHVPTRPVWSMSMPWRVLAWAGSRRCTMRPREAPRVSHTGLHGVIG